ncbi:SAM-dependent methyltransferase [Actinocorallia sp. B10E7]|uniref:SAM-dependent methyltransferase n=1 Tax=Actinocorallia sp. B10E7 TaxID=3153558 RepID=UPI00325D6931
MPSSESSAPRAAIKLNTDTAHPARVYDYWLRGKDNYEADRRVGDAMIAAIPETRQSCLDNRGFLTRAVRHLAQSHGIRQFLDIGSGLPTSPNVHEVAQGVAPESRIVYVDNDPIVQVHGRSLLTSSPEGTTTYLGADLREVEKILEEAAETLDLSRPVLVVLAAILHFVPEEADPRGLVRRFMEPLPAGSALALSHMTADGTPSDYSEHVKHTWAAGGVNMNLRGKEQIAEYFTGLELLDPGIVPVHQWRPDQQVDRPRWWLWSGVALKTS